MTRRALRSPWVQLALGLALVLLGLALRPTPPRLATFNVENYVAGDPREAELYEEIRMTGAPVVAVQEVRDPAAFARAASARLGERWRFVYADAGHAQRVGVLFDEERVTLVEAHTLEDTILGPRAKAALYARLRLAGRDRPLRVFVVHLTSGRDRAETRARQLAALRPALDRAVRSGDEVALLGDFNSVTEADREGLASLGHDLGLTWATRSLACSTYWQCADRCEAETLDHVLATDVSDARSHGGCARDGCGPMERCPAYRERVSDHCPVSVELP